MVALELLGIEQCWCPVVTVGAGTIVKTEHGPIPAAPGPAAAYILQDAGFALRFVESSHELVTPTGAAILAAVARPGPVTMTPIAHGAGAGTFDPPNRPNALRVFIGHAAVRAETRSIVELSANIDDMPPSLLANARDRLMEEGALDAWLEPIGMKKGRSASKLCVLVVPENEARFAALIMRETTTLGVRVAAYRRYETPRSIESVATSLGPVRVKWRERGDRRRGAPEFEDVKALAGRLGLPAIEVQRLLEAELESSAFEHGNAEGLTLPGARFSVVQSLRRSATLESAFAGILLLLQLLILPFISPFALLCGVNRCATASLLSLPDSCHD